MAPKWLNRLGFTKSLSLGAFLYTLVYMCGIYTATCHKYIYKQTQSNTHSYICSVNVIYPINLFVNYLCGIGGALLWGAQGRYISLLTTISNKGKLFGIFTGIYNTANILSGILSSVLFKYY